MRYLISSSFHAFPDLQGPTRQSKVLSIHFFTPQASLVSKVRETRKELLWLEIRHLRKRAIKLHGHTLGASEITMLHKWRDDHTQAYQSHGDDEEVRYEYIKVEGIVSRNDSFAMV